MQHVTCIKKTTLTNYTFAHKQVENKMTKYRCNVCNKFEYDDEKGMGGIEPDTKPEDFPDDWKCPICQADNTHQIPQ